MQTDTAALEASVGRAARAAAYVEPELYVLIQEVADAEGLSFSAWLRQLIIKDLVTRNKMSPDLLMKLAMG